mmetsp:Transcript_3653/g.6243  ORF Transcript_3653/g.6243 Transcript_3653/m.6243 type:complete len:261 (-) Transcript_3653:107-889(-)|eukprot:CAMPEP_0114431928 /NCGR_PEP_ID=MMETSP0103-20121206/10878_1 /TAXON_ID=37642 ORGANISM="Paraphysomonas imperforata, Strain PA2" /NCGR_SAMPLE_ID=MMETSP0103 /ASSEMBLY_ACC=CAM_ASM_000201 /LENGTH=260 /DNA_ID=CAMNT_0001601559 /DNA_START=130 /DNA_END=912 /DNA_ORIENTATION=+
MSVVETHNSWDDILLCQGAEGKVYLSTFCGKKAIVKERLKKSYRVPALDYKINKQRMQQEIRCMVKCRRAGVCTPLVYFVDQPAHRMTLEYIEGLTIKQFLLNTMVNGAPEDLGHFAFAIMREMGTAIGHMHDSDVVHGDLTTSNIMIRKVVGEGQGEQEQEQGEGQRTEAEGKQDFSHGDSFQVVLIDFGLGMTQPSVEDRAVDLYVLERAFLSTHPGSEKLVAAALDAYRFGNCKAGAAVLSRLEQVRQRGRKRDMCG